MSSITKVASTTDPPDYNDSRTGIPVRVEPGHMVTYVPADIIDRTRREAREQAYPNSTIEADAIRATDVGGDATRLGPRR